MNSIWKVLNKQRDAESKNKEPILFVRQHHITVFLRESTWIIDVEEAKKSSRVKTRSLYFIWNHAWWRWMNGWIDQWAIRAWQGLVTERTEWTNERATQSDDGYKENGPICLLMRSRVEMTRPELIIRSFVSWFANAAFKTQESAQLSREPMDKYLSNMIQ